MRTIVALTALLLGGAACAQSENECLASAEIAQHAAAAAQIGAEEQFIIKQLVAPRPSDSSFPKAALKVIQQSQVNIVRYVYTTRLAPADARATVYGKCMQGGLGHVNWSRHPGAWRTN